MTTRETPASASAWLLRQTLQAHRDGASVGVYSVCSAHPWVLEAAMTQAVVDEGFVLVEATSNQVDQFGGYSGMTPAAFRDFVFEVAGTVGLPRERVVLGGDHLGPNRWQGRPADEAMALAEDLVRSYVGAGFVKIHLDCSMSCAGDPVPLTDGIVAERSARLVKVAEESRPAEEDSWPLYVIGTEVPVPGGAHETIVSLTPTDPDAARATLAAHRAAFEVAGVPEAWSRVAGLVVQPGVEFDHMQVIDYDRSRTERLRAVVGDYPGLVFEAHSTDYQTPENLRALVEDHWAILKVGPGLTFALREALFALARIEDELVEESQRSRLTQVIDERMVAHPESWQTYYEGGEREVHLARCYSYSDRMRYYWSDAVIEAAVDRLIANLRATGIPLPLLSQNLPEQYHHARRGELPVGPRSIVVDHIRDALRPYSQACRPLVLAGASR